MHGLLLYKDFKLLDIMVAGKVYSWHIDRTKSIGWWDGVIAIKKILYPFVIMSVLQSIEG